MRNPGRASTLGLFSALFAAAAFLAAPSAGAQGTGVDARAEEGATVTFVISTSGYPQRQARLRYKYRTKDRSAEAGEDYKERTGTVTFVAGSSLRGIPVVTLADDIVEGNERFVFELYDRQVKNEFPGDTRWRSSSARYPRATKLKYIGKIIDK